MVAQSITILLKHTQATQQLGKVLGESLSAGSVVLLLGDLGAGKTMLVQGMGEGLGIQEPIVSPTFTLINEYAEGRLPLYHLDLYRLQASEVAEIYPETYWEGTEVSPGITAIEWAEHLPYKPPAYLEIQLADCDNGGRKAHLQQVGNADWVELSHISCDAGEGN
ncbi:MAG: tRNA (adenosine(37)-N6)-threonylcarbamoyltransferase complex ATPase subunit type 1 TsaE [Cyanobacteria bacterium QS_1_48_34]|nr:MAG: tRNA (adenosine(37)-N6)-threonylcarbamoyltransferase complex ATPase subunit type 1 TsaE [Cyanobacteria bacterium QS_1_48_34]